MAPQWSQNAISERDTVAVSGDSVKSRTGVRRLCFMACSRYGLPIVKTRRAFPLLPYAIGLPDILPDFARIGRVCGTAQIRYAVRMARD